MHNRVVSEVMRNRQHTMRMCGVDGVPVECNTTDIVVRVLDEEYEVHIAVMDKLPVDAALGKDLPLWDLLLKYQQKKASKESEKIATVEQEPVEAALISTHAQLRQQQVAEEQEAQ